MHTSSGYDDGHCRSDGAAVVVCSCGRVEFQIEILLGIHHYLLSIGKSFYLLLWFETCRQLIPGEFLQIVSVMQYKENR